ncbi:hypothetical protein GXB85_13630 [Cellulomonas sp. APG4]|uniref:hypothetical protein n=1 Tax=Cellulomonas sp. APG4 TaxID=1538656 RepID=UPI00137B9231|nr:hypothetical protein [Cellulomonas sp. APG4]NCT91983.1 hypothetical protein [Cellulomonas sp. APG4]
MSAAQTPAPAKLNPDTRRGVWLALVLLAVVVTPSFAMSAEALVATAREFAHPTLAWGAFIAYDVALVAFSFVASIYRQRGERALVVLAWLGIAVLTGLSVWVNHAHAVATGASVAAAVMAASFPSLVLFGTFLTERVLIASPAQVAAAATRAAEHEAAEAAAHRQRQQALLDDAAAARVAQAKADAEAEAAIARIRARADAESELAALEAAARVAERRAAAQDAITEHTSAENPAPQPVPAPVAAPAAVGAPAAPPTPPGPPTAPVVDDAARDAEVLRLVEQGMTDSAISRLPGMPSRATVGRVRARAAAAAEAPTGGDAQATLELVSA